MKKSKQVAISLAVIFNDKGEILLTQRDEPKSKHSHGKWQLPGGTIEFGEHPEDTVYREIMEETGLDIELLLDHPLIFSHVYKESNVHILMHAYPAQYVDGDLNISQDPNTGDAQWYSYDAINFMNCLPLTKEIIDEAKTYIHN